MGKYLDMIQHLRGEEALAPIPTLEATCVEEQLGPVAPPRVAGAETAEPTPTGYETNELHEIRSGSVVCACNSIPGPAEVGPRYQPCSACGKTWRCRACGGCRRCRARPVVEKAALTTDYDLPFPIGYDGLPRAQVEMAPAWLGKVGVTDPILHKYNVMSWVRRRLQWNGQNRDGLYEASKGEQFRLGRILDPSGDPEGQGTSLEGNEL